MAQTRVSTTSAELATIRTLLEVIDEKVDKLVVDIQGNGKPGLKTDVLNLKNKVENLENSRQPLSKAGWIIFTAVVSSVTAAISGLIVAFVK